MTRVSIIAEAGVNHNGDESLAFKLVDAAIEAGADAVKFQTFKAEDLVTKSALKANYQKNTTGTDESQYEMLKRLELSYEAHHKLLKYCGEKKIKFLSTAFDSDSLSFLVNNLGLTKLKIPSGEITNAPLLLLHAQTGCDLIVSTGMATLSDIETALGIIAFGYMNKNAQMHTISKDDFQKAYCTDEARHLLKNKVTILHCTSEYPAPLSEINLNVMYTLREAFGLDVGYSDHSEGISIPIAAAAIGATIIEKHFTLDKSMPGPDHLASLDPSELKDMISAVRAIEMAMGYSCKAPTQSEIENRKIIRKSLCARNVIRKGDIFTADNICVKRPGTGLDPIELWSLMGKKADKDYDIDDIIGQPH